MEPTRPGRRRTRASSSPRPAASCSPRSCSCCPRSPATATTSPRASRICASAASTARASIVHLPSSSGTAWSSPGPGTPKAGQARRVYGLTEEGQRALRGWMGVIKQERDCLDLVLRRYVATGTVDAALAEAEGGWAAVTGQPWSPVSATSRIERHRHGVQRAVPVGRRRDLLSNGRDEPATPSPVPDGAAPARFAVVPDRSVVLIEARSTVGPITFGAVGVTGVIEAEVHDGQVAAGARAVRAPRDRGRPACARATASTTPSCSAGSTPAAIRSSPSTCGVARAVGSADRLPRRRRRHLPRRQPPDPGHGQRVACTARPQAGGERRAGVRHPRLRHRLADGAHAAHLPRRARAAAGRGRAEGSSRAGG